MANHIISRLLIVGAAIFAASALPILDDKQPRHGEDLIRNFLGMVRR